jgi:hypothetical protein
MAVAAMIRALLLLGIGALFFWAGAVKIWDAQQFALDVHHYRLTPSSVSVAVAVYLPWLELCAGLALIVRRLTLGALLALTGLSVIFIAALASAWARGLDITCGCFGRGAETVRANFPLLIGRDLILLAALAVLLAMEWRAQSRGVGRAAGGDRG